MLDSVVDLASGSAWTYAVVLAVAALDVLVPVLPSETLLVAAAALTATGRLQLGGVVAAAAVGALAGDNLAYVVGRTLGPRVTRRLGASTVRRLRWAERQLDDRGATIIVVSRFVPGGRTAAMLAAGILVMPWRRFVLIDLAAAATWALYGGLVGSLSGKTFADDPLKGVVLALALALALGALIELVRRTARRDRAVGDAP